VGCLGRAYYYPHQTSIYHAIDFVCIDSKMKHILRRALQKNPCLATTMSLAISLDGSGTGPGL
jgi:hypothetical protein